MWRRLSKKEQEKYYRKWIKEIADCETKLSLKRHIVRHAKEIYDKNSKEWSTSMKNLLESFNEMNQIDTTTAMCLKKLENKYKTNPRRYTPPPKI